MKIRLAKGILFNLATLLPEKIIWNMDITKYFVLLRSVENGNDLSIEDDMYFRVKVAYSGQIFWVPFLKSVTACDLDLTYFPMDQQSCDVILINWMYGFSLINFIIQPNINGYYVDTTGYIRSSGWDLISTSLGSNVTTDNIPFIYFNFVLQRVSTYFILNVIIPTVCLSVLSAMVFRMPPEAGEKMGLSVTVLMSYSVMLMIMSDNIPRSNKLPIISKTWLDKVMIIC